MFSLCSCPMKNKNPVNAVISIIELKLYLLVEKNLVAQTAIIFLQGYR